MTPLSVVAPLCNRTLVIVVHKGYVCITTGMYLDESSWPGICRCFALGCSTYLRGW